MTVFSGLESTGALSHERKRAIAIIITAHTNGFKNRMIYFYAIYFKWIKMKTGGEVGKAFVGKIIFRILLLHQLNFQILRSK